jgi:hypothetical protein
MKTPITVRIEAELLAEARQCAQAENRTLTNFIETVLRQRVAEPRPKSASHQPRDAQRSRQRSTDAR